MLAGLTDRSWIWIAAGFYLTGFLLGTWSLLRAVPQSKLRLNLVIAGGYACQFAGLYLRGLQVGGCPLGNQFELFQFTAWSALTLYFAVGVSFRSSVLGYFTSTLACVLTVSSLALPAWDATRRPMIFGGHNPWIELHASLALFSYGVFALLALTSLLLLLRHHSLESKKLGGWFSFLPPIFDLDQICVRLLVTGVVLLMIALLGGSVFWLRVPGSVNVVKILVTVAVWLAYALTLGLRLRGTLLAKRFAWVCSALFIAALVSLWVVDANRHSAPRATPTVSLPR